MSNISKDAEYLLQNYQSFIYKFFDQSYNKQRDNGEEVIEILNEFVAQHGADRSKMIISITPYYGGLKKTSRKKGNTKTKELVKAIKKPLILPEDAVGFKVVLKLKAEYDGVSRNAFAKKPVYERDFYFVTQEQLDLDEKKRKQNKKPINEDATYQLYTKEDFKSFCSLIELEENTIELTELV